jgi:DNA (cytosine-5)-methyltransferase 1
MSKGINTTCDEGQTLIPTTGGGFDVVHAFDARQSDVIQYGDMTGPLDTDGHSVAITIRTANTSSNGCGIDEETAYTLDRAQGQAVAFDAYNQSTSPVSHPLRVGLGNGSGDEIPQTITNMQVRRLTPRECERLQGFPDDYTLIPHRGKPAADGPRYKALGNSMAVPCMAWIGQRIAMVEQLEKEAKNG